MLHSERRKIDKYINKKTDKSQNGFDIRTSRCWLLTTKCSAWDSDCYVPAEVPDGSPDEDVVLHGCGQYVDRLSAAETAIVDSETAVRALCNAPAAGSVHPGPSVAVASAGQRYDFSMLGTDWHLQCSLCARNIAVISSTCHYSTADACYLSVDKIMPGGQ